MRQKKKRVKQGRRGRPRKYQAIIRALEPDELYTASSIVNSAKAQGLLDSYIEDNHDRAQLKTRIRVALNDFRRKHAFSEDGDGFIHIKGEGKVVAWYGWRWQKEYLEP